MAAPSTSFRESNLFGAPIRDLGLSIADTRLEPIIREFEAELLAVGITRLKPRFHLSTEWGVPFQTIVIGIPFYLARPELTALHGEEVGHIEGFNRNDILRYLRHEMGHVVNYAYKLYEQEGWVERYGSITQPYVEDYRPQPFSRRFVRHLPGWYAQKHPDEDWAETFAVWMTPKLDWRKEYGDWPTALAKLEFCEATMLRSNALDPLVVAVELDEDVGDLTYSLQQYYKQQPAEAAPAAAGLEGALRAMFDDLASFEERGEQTESRPAGPLFRKLERQLMAEVFRWTGHFPEKTRSLMRYLAQRADALQQVYPAKAEADATIDITVLVTSLAMNHVHRGSYFPEPQAVTPPVAGEANAAPIVGLPPADISPQAVTSQISPAAPSPPAQPLPN
jgi:hypothetical protein